MLTIAVRKRFCFAVAAALLAAAAARAQNADAPRRSADKLQLATYEVGDLVVSVPDYAAPESDSDAAKAFGGRGYSSGGGFGGGGGGYGGVGFGPGGAEAGPPAMGGSPQGGQAAFDPNSITLTDLVNVIPRVVLPDTWNVNGTGPGQIEAIGASLVVLQTPEAHELIQGLLHDLRAGSGKRRSVSIDARWVLLNSDEFDRLQPNLGKAQHPSVDAAVLADFTRRPTSLRGFTNCFSGQSVYLISGARRNVVRSYIPVVGSVERPFGDGDIIALTVHAQSDNDSSPLDWVQEGGRKSVGYQPVIETPNFGVLLKIRPTLIHGEDAAVVDLISTITFPGVSSDSSLDVPPPDGMAPMVDRLAVDTQELATTLRVPLGKPVLVGGMSYIAPAAGATASEPSDAAAPQDEAQETRQLYLVLEVR
jgi:hypothetical protein